MGKYTHLKVLRKTKARTQHICNRCNKIILAGDFYYKEHIEDKFLYALNASKYCVSCYENDGNDLLLWQRKLHKKYKTEDTQYNMFG
jgi:hypothetical protein